MTTTVKPCIWIESDARAAVEAYVALVPDSEILSLNTIHDPTGAEVVGGEFRLAGVDYRLLSGPAEFHLNPSFSIALECDSQAEVDRYWDVLVAGGTPSRCGWLVDRWGLSWQIYPRQLSAYLGDADPRRSRAAFQAMFAMDKIVLADIRAAVDAVGDPA